ncbi:MAG: HigA family addiction module antitoxin [Geminicoccaceae bacterium]
MTRTPIHPREILADELEEIDVKPTHLAEGIDVPANRISAIVNGKRSITADTSLRPGHYFGQAEDFWLKLQARYDLDLAHQKMKEMGLALDRIIKRGPLGQ